MVFLAIPGALDARGEEKYQLWNDYLTVMVKGGYARSERDEFFERLGIDPRDFDWQGWREVMGYHDRG
jgi:hypothetical protein